MDDKLAYKTFQNISSSIKSRFTSKKTLISNLSKLDEIAANLHKIDDAETLSLILHMKIKHEDELSKTDKIHENYLQSARNLFESIFKDISDGRKYSPDILIEAISNYELYVKSLLTNQRKYVACSVYIEMGMKLKQIFKFDEAYLKFTNASQYAENNVILLNLSYWQSICCLIYSHNNSKLKSLLLDIVCKLEDHSMLQEYYILLLLVDVILNPNKTTIQKFFKLDFFTSFTNKRLLFNLKSLCYCYINGDIQSFKLIEEILYQSASYEQLFIIYEMRYRIENDLYYSILTP